MDSGSVAKVLKLHVKRTCKDDEAQARPVHRPGRDRQHKAHGKRHVVHVARAGELYAYPQGWRALLYLLVPRAPRHFTPAQSAWLAETIAIHPGNADAHLCCHRCIFPALCVAAHAITVWEKPEWLAPKSAFLVFGAKISGDIHSNRTIWLGQTDATSRCRFFECDRGKNFFQYVGFSGRDAAVDKLCTLEIFQMHRAIRLNKATPAEDGPDARAQSTRTEDGNGAALDRWDTLNNMFKGKQLSCDIDRTASIAWLAALLREPLIACDLDLGLDLDLEDPQEAESVARAIYDHGNAPETKQHVFTLSEVVRASRGEEVGRSAA
ncbi:hypothetical protein DFH11DRAFT_1729432 [Phellopilus nigrolimitatus]|nr:hypothetical protein DFH11DRAFT_1729432 [Phellopilus nigrolimitatus]